MTATGPINMEAAEQWCQFMFELFVHAMTCSCGRFVSPDSNIHMVVPSLLATISCLLTSAGEKTEKRLRRRVFAASSNGVEEIQGFLRCWESELTSLSSKSFRVARGISMDIHRSNSYSLQTFRMLNKMSLEHHLISWRGKRHSDVRKEHADWLTERLRLADRFLHCPSSIFKFSPSKMTTEKTMIVSSATRSFLTFDQSVSVEFLPHPVDLKFVRRKKRVKEEFGSFRLALKDGDQLKAVRCNKHWLMVRLPLAERPLQLYFIVSSTRRKRQETLFPDFNFANVKKWINDIEGDIANTYRLPSLVVPRFAMLPKRSLELSSCLVKAKLDVLFDGRVAFGDLFPHGRMISFQAVDLLTINEKTSSITSARNEHTQCAKSVEKIVNWPFFTVIWDGRRHLPVSLSRIGQQSDESEWQKWDERSDNESDESSDNRHEDDNRSDNDHKNTGRCCIL